MEKNFELGGRKFQLSKLDAFKQYHIVRRVGPILSDLLPAMSKAKADDSKLSQEEKLENIANFLTPIMNGLSKLSDGDAEFVLLGLLQAVEVKQEPLGNWGKVAVNSMLMMQDLELPILLQLAGRAFFYNLSGFFAALPQ
jgi:cytochrome c551/c552